MKLYLNCYFPHAEHLALAKDWGFAGVRTGPESPSDAAEVVARVREAGLEGLFLSRDASAIEQLAFACSARTGCAIELGNEEDSKLSPQDYQRWMWQAAESAHRIAPSIPLFTAGITTPDRKRLDWLHKVYALGVPAYVQSAIHTYRTEREPNEAHAGFRDRAAEFRAVRQIIQGRRLIISEIGWHTCESERKRRGLWGLLGFTETVQFSEEQVAENLAAEARICRDAGAEIMVIYQVVCGPDPLYYEDNFGLLRRDGSPTPAALAIKSIAGEVA